MAGPSIISQTRQGLRYFFTERLMEGFAGGLNLRDAPTELKPNESPSVWNVTLDERGGVVKRLGYTNWNAAPTTGVLHFDDSAGSAYVTFGVFNENKVYLEVDGTVPQSALDAWYGFLGDPGPSLMGVLNGDNTTDDRLQLRDNPFTGAYYQMHPEEGWVGGTTIPAPTGGVPFTLKLELNNAGTSDYAIDSTVASGDEDMSGSGPWTGLAVGITTLDRFGEHALGNESIAGGEWDCTAIRCGTTAGGTDLFNWIAADNTDLSDFDSVVGGATFVAATGLANPFQDSYFSLLLDKQFWYSPADGKLYKDVSGTLTNVKTFTANARLTLVDFAGDIYAAHGIDGLFSSSDGTSWGAVSKGMHTADIPVGELMAVWQNKLWIASSGDNKLWFSAPGDATDWDAVDGGGSVNVREKDDAPMVALHGGSGIDFQSEPGLFCFKRDSMYRVLDSATGSYLAIDGSIGAASKNSVTSLYGELIFISRRGIYQTKKLAAIIPVAEQVLPLFAPDSTDDTKLNNFCAGYLGDRVYFSITTQDSSGGKNNLALEYAPLYGWVTAGSNAMSVYTTVTGLASERVLAADPSVGAIYRLFDGGSDAGADIVSWYESRWFEVSSGHQARLQLARFLFRGTPINVSAYVDFGDNAAFTDILNSTTDGMEWGVGSWSSDGSGGLWGGSSQEAYQADHPRLIGRAFKFRIDETSSKTYTRPPLLGDGASLQTGAWALYSIESQYGPLGLA